MKPSSSWSSRIHRLTADWRARRPCPPLHISILFCLIMAACSSPESLPPRFDAIIRIPLQKVQVHGHTIAFLDVGEGEPVILIHGFGGSMWQWEHQQIPLSRYVRVITPDLLGSGFSDKPDIAYRPDQMLDFFVGFMDALHLSRATLVGNSMGAGLAMGMALTHPSRVSQLILIDGLPDHVLDKLTSPTVRRALETGAPSWFVSFGNWLFGGFMTKSILQEIIHDPALLTPAVIERSNRNRKQPGIIAPVMAARNNLPLWESDFATRIAEIRHRTLILWGEEDRVFPLAVGEQLQRTIKGATLIRIPRAGHIPQWEQPDLSNQAMVEFLKL